MFCYKCGAELPDKSQFCYKCGSKICVDKRTDTSNGELLENKKTKVFYVGNGRIEFTESEYREVLLRSIFEKNAEISRLYLKSYAMWEIDSFEKMYNEYREKFSKIINQNLVIAIKILMKFGVDTYDKSSLYDLVVKRINMEELLKEYFADFERVEQRVLELNDEAEERKKIKSPWRGGGAGFSGAIKGAILASILNAGSNLIGVAEDGLISSFDQKEIKNLKRACFNNGTSIEILTEILYTFICDLGEVVYLLLIKDGAESPNHWWTIDKMLSKRNNAIELYNTREISKEEMIDALCVCYQVFPIQVYIKDDLWVIDRGLVEDIWKICCFDGTERYAVRSFMNMDSYYSLAYYVKLRDENGGLPKLNTGTEIITFLLNKEESSAEYTHKSLPIEEIVKLILQVDMLSAIFESVRSSTHLENKRSALAEILDDDNFFEKTIKEMMVYESIDIDTAVNASKTSAIAILQLNDEEKAIMEEISGNIILAIKNGIEKITEELKEKSDFQDAIRDYDRYMLNSNFIENK